MPDTDARQRSLFHPYAHASTVTDLSRPLPPPTVTCQRALTSVDHSGEQRGNVVARTRSLLLAGLLATPLVFAGPAAAQAAACGHVRSDFNGDGYADLAVGDPQRDQPIDPNQGGVVVLYGSASGMGGSRKTDFFTSYSAGMPTDGLIGGSDRLGEALASGYFDGDCYADLAVGAPGGGALVILYGSESGLTTTRSADFDRRSIQPGGAPNTGFGLALAAGDFNGDGRDDVAVGAPETEEFIDEGAVGVLYGSAAGVTPAGAVWLDQDTPGVPGTGGQNDTFGWSLAAGDFDGDRRADLAVGIPDETLGSHDFAGGVVVLRGSAGGLTGAGAQWFDQDTAGVPGAPEARDWFGNALTAGDLTGDGRAELVVGAPGEGVGSTFSAGLVTVLRGSAGGLTGTGAVSYDQNTEGVPGTAESQDTFGGAVAIGDFNSDGRPDLAVGAPDESVGTALGTGSVTILYGVTGGLSATGARYLDQNSPGVPGANEENDFFGGTLKALPDALVIDALHESAGGVRDGAFTILPSGKAAQSGTFFHGGQLPSGAQEDAELGYAFG